MTAVFVQTNEQEGNRVLAFTREEGGALAGFTSYETGGEGDGLPHLTSQGSVVLSGERTRLLVTNAGSDDISVFAVGDGELSLLDTVPTRGGAPKSVAEHDGLVYVLDTGAPSLAGFRLDASGLRPLEGSERELSPDADPAQVGFSPDGSALLVTDRGTDSLVVYPVDAEGVLGEPAVAPSSGPTPYGFAFAGDRTLVVTEAFGAQPGKAAASSYVVDRGAPTPVSRSVGNGRSEICWAVVTPDGRYAFTTNFADGRCRATRSATTAASRSTTPSPEPPSRASRGFATRGSARRPLPLCARRGRRPDLRLGRRRRRDAVSGRVVGRRPGDGRRARG